MVILKPRLSRRQPIEAAATPLPREETTPPVTNIYFGPVRKALAILRKSRRTEHYGQNCGESQITISNRRYFSKYAARSPNSGAAHAFAREARSFSTRSTSAG